MTLRTRPNLMVPVLLLAISLFGGIGATVGQAQVQKWTPNSASTVQPSGGDSGTHQSRTNCYPCKIWDTYNNSGNGGWDYLPYGTEPIECPGDTNNYACKMCGDYGVVINRPNGTSVDAGDGCGCCKDGEPWAPEPDCPDPIEVNFEFSYLGPCPCYYGELGCVTPVPTPVSFISFSSCYDSCEWKPVPPDSFTIGYFEGICPERCEGDGVIYSADDVNAENYCAVLAKLKERIEKQEEWVVNPPTSSIPDPSSPPESYCFVDCMMRHEAIHVEQLRCMWDDLKVDILDALSGISVPFECDTAETPEQADQAMEDQLRDEMQLVHDRFWERWRDPDKMTEHEREAHQDTLDCFNDLLEQINNKAQEQNWPDCNQPDEEET
jgi:hypothetical protein